MILKKYSLVLVLVFISATLFAQTGNNMLNPDSTQIISKKKKKKKGDEIPVEEIIPDGYIVPDNSTATKPKKNKQKHQKNASSVKDTIPTIIHDANDIDWQSKRLILEGKKLNDAGKFFEAVSCFDSVLNFYQMAINSNEAYLWRAKAKFGMHDSADAMNDVNTFIKLEGNHSKLFSDAKFTQGSIYFAGKNFKEATSAFREASKDSLFPQRKYAYLYYAYSLGETGNYTSAIQYFTKFIQLDKMNTVSSADALFNRAYYKSKMSDNRGAVSDYNDAFNLYLLVYTSSKNMTYYNKMIETLMQRGLANSDVQKYTEAVEDFTEVLKYDSHNATAYRLRGLAKIKGNLKDEGCTDLSTAGEMGDSAAYDDIKQWCK